MMRGGILPRSHRGDFAAAEWREWSKGVAQEEIADDDGMMIMKLRRSTAFLDNKKDELLQYKLEGVPFLEEQVRKIKETGKLLTMDVQRLFLFEDNRFDFINEVAAEANEYVENNRDEYGGTKKAILHAMSNRVNDMGFERPESYTETGPYKPGPGYLKQDFT